MYFPTSNNSKTVTLSEAFAKALAKEIRDKEVAVVMGQTDKSKDNYSLPGGLMPTSISANLLQEHRKRKKEKERFDELLFYLIVLDAFNRIDKLIEQMLREMDKLIEVMQKIQQELQKLEDDQDLLEQELERYRASGKFDFDEKGKLRNPNAEKILKEWEANTGKKINRNSPDLYETILCILAKIDQERKVLEFQNKEYSKQYDYHQNKLKEAQQLKEQLQSGNPEKQQVALAKIDALFSDLNNNGEEIQNKFVPQNTETTNSLTDEFSFTFPSLQEGNNETLSTKDEFEQKEFEEDTQSKPGNPVQKGIKP